MSERQISKAVIRRLPRYRRYLKELEKKGGLKSFEVLSEEIAEDGNSAVVKFKQVYGNGEESEDEQKMVKVDGKWLMDIGK